MMRHLIMLRRIMLAGTRNFFRNAWLSAAATVVMVVTLTVLLTAVILNLALKDTLKEVTTRIDIAVFLEDSATTDQVVRLEERFKQSPNIESTKYISKGEALARYREQNKNSPELLEAITEQENPLPASLELVVKDLSLIEPIIAVTREAEFDPMVQDTSYSEDRQRTIERIAGINKFLTRAGVITGIVFTIIAVLIIFNTIRMAIFSRREEVQIMRLIGATNSYIRGPFLFEAMLDGMLAAVISLTLVFTALYSIGSVSYVNLTSTFVLFQDKAILVVLATLLAGIVIGIFSSMLAMVRYLKL